MAEEKTANASHIKLQNWYIHRNIFISEHLLYRDMIFGSKCVFLNKKVLVVSCGSLGILNSNDFVLLPQEYL